MGNIFNRSFVLQFTSHFSVTSLRKFLAPSAFEDLSFNLRHGRVPR